MQISTSMHLGRPMDHSGPVVDCHCPAKKVGDEHNLQDRKDKACPDSRSWIEYSGAGPVEEVGGCILAEGIERVEEVGGRLAGRGSGASFPAMAPRRPAFGRDMPWDYTRHPWAHLRHMGRSLDPVVNDASAIDFHQEMMHNADYLGTQTYLLVYVVKAYCYLFEPVLEHMAGMKVATSKSKDRQLVTVLIEDPDVIRAL